MKKFTHANVSPAPAFFFSVRKTNPLFYATAKTLLSSLLALFITASAFAQAGRPEDKIDPVFKYVIAQSKSRNTPVPKGFSSVFKSEPAKGFAAKGGPLEEGYDCIVYTSDAAALRAKGIVVNSVLPSFVTAWVTAEQIQQLAEMSTVKYIEAPTMDRLHNDIAVGNTGASLLHQGKLNNTVYKGKGVIVAIFDSGIDWKHLDFRDPVDTTKSRILRIWDQTITPIAGETSPSPFNYGVEYTQAQISDELDGTPTGYVRESDVNGHGTHVAGTAAGNGAAIPATRKYTGMAPEADIVVVKGGNGSFSTTNIINGITYLKNLSAALGKPIVMNMSLGGQFGPHDGTRAYELAVDDFTASAPGRAVVISAGNDNGANIHNRLSLASGEAGATVSFTVPAGTTGTDVFEYRVYVNDNSDVSATFTAPGGGSVTALAGQSSSGVLVSSSFNVYVENAVEAGNGDRYIDVYVARNGSNTTSPAGTWTLSLTNNTASTLTLDGWLYYTNSVFSGTVLVGGNSDYLVGSPGNATSAITAASFVGRASWYTYGANGGFYGTTARADYISTFSSHGPRRDGVLKPEIAATGQHVISALSSASAPSASDIVLPGRYLKNQGTSMSAPVITGAVALMLQANPSATVTQLRSAMFSNATKDAVTELPGATPNTTWGYGRLDVYKAAGALFACATVNRKTYQYDAPNLTTEDNGVTNTTTRVAVRFTPDISGKMAGAYFHTSLTKTALVMEVRSNNAGVPGTLLGTVNLADTVVAAYSWNYVDLSGLNLSVTSGTDYFVVVYRSAASAANWSLRRENTSLDNRSLTSSDGVTWTNPGYDYKIRSVVYSSTQIAGSIATASSADSRDVNTSNQFINGSCQLVAQLTPAGLNPVSGSVSANVWIEPGVPTYGGKPFVARHYQITPATSPASATGRVTLYFTQAEFTAFNADAGSTLDLPANPTDNAGKANLRVAKYEGSSSNGSGLPGTYSGGVTLIDPADGDIVWNADASRWEVSFDVTGFSGFIVQTSLTVLPVYVESFSGYKQGATNLLNWKVSCINSAPVFEIERSGNGIDFSSIGALTARGGCSLPFNFKDAQPLSGNNYYRIKITDNGTVHYTNVLLLQTDRALLTALYPTVIKKGGPVQVTYAEAEGLLRVNDAAGKQVYSRTLAAGTHSFSLPVSASGIYFYSIQNSRGVQATGKLIIQ